MPIYIKYRFQAPIGNDLQLLLKDPKDFEMINQEIATLALKNILGHSQYLSKAFFDDELSVQNKKKIVDALKIEDSEDS